MRDTTSEYVYIDDSVKPARVTTWKGEQIGTATVKVAWRDNNRTYTWRGTVRGVKCYGRYSESNMSSLARPYKG